MFSAGANAFLRIGCARVRALFLPQENRLELVHAGVGEEQRRIIQRDDGAAGHEGVAVLFDEEVDEFLADLLAGFHG